MSTSPYTPDPADPNAVQPDTGYTYSSTDPVGTYPATESYATTETYIPPAEPLSGGYGDGGQSSTTDVAKDEASNVKNTAKDEAANVKDTAVGEAASVKNTAVGEAAAVKDTAVGEAAAVKDTALEAGRNVAGTAKEEVTNVVAEAGSQVKSLLSTATSELSSQAGTQKGRLAETLRGYADELTGLASGKSADQPGIITDLLNQVASKGDEVVSWVENRDPKDILEDVRNFARRRPGLFLTLSGFAGVLAGRLTRGAVAANTSVDSPKPQGGFDSSPSYVAPTGPDFTAAPTSTYGAYTDAPTYTEPVAYTEPTSYPDPAVYPDPGAPTTSWPETGTERGGYRG